MTKKPSKSIGGINVTPMVDIMLVLLIILMVTAEYTHYHAINVRLPKLNAVSMKREPAKLSITLAPDKTIYVGKEKIKNLANLIKRLKSMKGKDKNFSVILRAETKTQYGDLLVLLDGVKSSGISHVGLAIEPVNKKKR